MKKSTILNKAWKAIGVMVLGCFGMLSSSSVQAQNYYDGAQSSYKPISMGITFSPNISWLRYGDEEGFDGRAGLGFAYGLLSDIAFSENYYFSTGLVINSLYTEAATTLQEKPAYIKHRLQYAEVPLAIKLKSSENFNRSFYGKFGFSLGAKVSGKERINDADKRSKIQNANMFRMAMQIGGGAEWNLDYNMRLLTGLTFNNGFTRTMKAGEPKNSYLSFDFGFLF